MNLIIPCPKTHIHNALWAVRLLSNNIYKFFRSFFFMYSDINFNLRCLSKYLTATLLKHFYSEAISLKTFCFVMEMGLRKVFFFKPTILKCSIFPINSTCKLNSSFCTLSLPPSLSSYAAKRSNSSITLHIPLLLLHSLPPF